jgi:hypothetical protein
MDQYNFTTNKDFEVKENTPKYQNQMNLGVNSPSLTNISNQSQYNHSVSVQNEQRVDPFTFNQIELFLQQQVNL